MSRYDSNFSEPPWVIGSSKEVMDWIGATNPNKKKKNHKENQDDYLENIHVHFDLDVEKKEIKPLCLICRKAGLFTKIDENFDIYTISETILRGLGKARFRNTEKIIIDGETIYDHPEKFSDLRKTIDIIEKYKDKIRNSKKIEISATIKDVETCNVKIRINRLHKKKGHPIEIQIFGKLKSQTFHTFLNYLNEKVEFKK